MFLRQSIFLESLTSPTMGIDILAICSQKCDAYHSQFVTTCKLSIWSHMRSTSHLQKRSLSFTIWSYMRSTSPLRKLSLSFFLTMQISMEAGAAAAAVVGSLSTLAANEANISPSAQKYGRGVSPGK